jgi:drug/metabolite transporter (DMT)-like permease
MVLNTAPVFATFIAAPSLGVRLGALLAFAGVAAALWGEVGPAAIAAPHMLALTAAVAYAASILVLGHLAKAGEAPSTTNSLYNAAAGLCVGAALFAARPAAPASWLPVLSIGVIAALRIQVLTVAAVSPAVSARVSVLSNLAFVWLAIGEAARGGHEPARWGALALVVAGTSLANAGGSAVALVARLILRRPSPRKRLLGPAAQRPSIEDFAVGAQERGGDPAA